MDCNRSILLIIAIFALSYPSDQDLYPLFSSSLFMPRSQTNPPANDYRSCPVSTPRSRPFRCPATQVPQTHQIIQIIQARHSNRCKWVTMLDAETMLSWRRRELAWGVSCAW